MKNDLSLEERFWSKVDRRTADECWPWTAASVPAGYGLFRVRGCKWMQRANRLAWSLTFGEIPPGMFVLHRCDVPACCNPAHLFLGTNADNIADKVAKGRSHFPQPKRRGQNHPMAKLTQAQVEAIRARATGRRGEGKALAAEYGVSRALVSRILSGKVWAHV